MKCFKCLNVVCRTEYPEGSVQSVCPKCSWRSSKVKIPIKIPSVKSISLVNTPKSNIFDEIYINNRSRVDSMSQKCDCFYGNCGQRIYCYDCISQNKCPAYLCADTDICLMPKYHALIAEMKEDVE